MLPEHGDEPINIQQLDADSGHEDLPGDDRDLLEIFEDRPSGTSTAVAEPRARRREYRQLFATLRRS